VPIFNIQARRRKMTPMLSRLALTMAFLLVATAAFAQSRPSTLRMTCTQAQGLVASRGSIVLSTGPYTFNRFVTGPGFCFRGEVTEPVWVRTADSPECFIGYKCKPRERRLFD
jgi:hypothetical protein